MAEKLTVRVIRTYHVDVTPEYGDTEDTLRTKGLDALKANTKPDDETVVVLPKGADR